MKKPITVYVGCALSDAPVTFQEEIIALKNEIRRLLPYVIILDFVPPNEDKSPHVIWKHDCACIERCDVFLAVADFPSLGLGGELTEALRIYKKPTLVVASQGVRVSRYVLGLVETHSHLACFREFNSWSQIIGHLEDFFLRHDVVKKNPLAEVREQNPAFMHEAPIYHTD